MKRRHLLAAAGGLLATPAIAQGAWPSVRPIRFIATFPAGGFADTMARLLAEQMSQRLGQAVMVENRVGGAGTVGAAAAAQAAPDGYTLVLSHSSPFGVAAGTFPNLSYHVVDSFTHMSLMAESANLLIVRADSPLQNFEQFLEMARREPVRFAHSGVGSMSHLMGEVLVRAANVPNLEHVPYRGSAPGLQDLLGGRVESMMDPITTNTGLIRNGQVRVLAISTPNRIPAFPDIPTFAEQGMPVLTNTTWAGLSAPKGLDPAIAARLTEAAVLGMQAPLVQERLEQVANYAPEPPVTGQAYADFIRSFADTWGGAAREAGVVAG